jgi:hypothetical protein
MAAFAKKSAVGVKGADRAAAGSIQNDSGLPQGPAGRFRDMLRLR